MIKGYWDAKHLHWKTNHGRLSLQIKIKRRASSFLMIAWSYYHTTEIVQESSLFDGLMSTFIEILLYAKFYSWNFKESHTHWVIALVPMKVPYQDSFSPFLSKSELNLSISAFVKGSSIFFKKSCEKYVCIFQEIAIKYTFI